MTEVAIRLYLFEYSRKLQSVLCRQGLNNAGWQGESRVVEGLNPPVLVTTHSSLDVLHPEGRLEPSQFKTQ